MTRTISRRAMLGIAIGTTIAMRRDAVRGEPIDIPTVALPASVPATPRPTTALYSGPVSDLWDQPWLLEGKQIALKGTILQRLVAPAGRGYRISDDGIVFRSLVDLDIPEESDVFVVTNDDLRSISQLRTVEVIGSYGGIADSSISGHRGIPIVVASTIRKVTS